MSGIYEEPERRGEDSEYKDYLQQLLDGEDVTGVPAEIVRQVIAEGEESLVGIQKFIFDTRVRTQFLCLKCTECDNYIPFHEAYQALHGDELCGMCSDSRQQLLRKEIDF